VGKSAKGYQIFISINNDRKTAIKALLELYTIFYTPTNGENTMPRYVIERDIPKIGTAEREDLRGAAEKSNGVLAEMKAEQKNIQWEHSYVAENKTFCIYIADSLALIQEHAERSGFPATMVTEVSKMIDPVTAEN